jgi:hypothetical protein
MYLQTLGLKAFGTFVSDFLNLFRLIQLSLLPSALIDTFFVLVYYVILAHYCILSKLLAYFLIIF